MCARYLPWHGLATAFPSAGCSSDDSGLGSPAPTATPTRRRFRCSCARVSRWPWARRDWRRFDAIAKSGFGVACTRGSGESAITYEFLALVGGTWEILLRHGSSSTDPETGLLKQGSSSASPGSSSVTVEGMCATLADGRTTRLALFINNSVVADITDPTAGSTPAGWFTDFIMRSQAARPSTVTATHFEVRDID